MNAIDNEDVAFLKKVYMSWFKTSEILPLDQEEYFFSNIFVDLNSMKNSKLIGTETFDGFDIAHMKNQDESEYQLIFQKNGEDWIYFNERSNYSLFKNTYAINYNIEDGKLRILFNGTRSPIVTDIDSTSGLVSLINSSLKIGENEITLQSLDEIPIKVMISISNCEKRKGAIMTTNGNVLQWNGVVKEPVKLKFLVN